MRAAWKNRLFQQNQPEAVTMSELSCSYDFTLLSLMAITSENPIACSAHSRGIPGFSEIGLKSLVNLLRDIDCIPKGHLPLTPIK